MALALIFESVGVGEWLVLLAVLLVVIGPRRLPEAARTFGKHYSKFRRAAESFKRQLLEMDTEFTNAVAEAEREVGQAADATERAFTIDDNPTESPYDRPHDYDYPTDDEPKGDEPAETGEPPVAAGTPPPVAETAVKKSDETSDHPES